VGMDLLRQRADRGGVTDPRRTATRSRPRPCGGRKARPHRRCSALARARRSGVRPDRDRDQRRP
jgi:hypothetical protein